jgi:hypothetical protein
MRIALDDITNPQVKGIFRADAGKDGAIEIDTAGMVVFLPSLACSPLYELRAPIKAVYPGSTFLGMSEWILIVPFLHDDGGSLESSGTWAVSRFISRAPQGNDIAAVSQLVQIVAPPLRHFHTLLPVRL